MIKSRKKWTLFLARIKIIGSFGNITGRTFYEFH